MRTTILLLLALGLSLAATPRAYAEDGADLRAVIDAALAEPGGVTLERRADDSPWSVDTHPIGGADPCDPPDPCAGPWTFAAGLGLSLAQGNSDKFDLALDAVAQYKRDPYLFRIEGLFAYGESDGNTTTEAFHVTVRGERKLGNQWYLFGQVDYDRDEPADLEYRWTSLGGLGVYLRDTPLLSFKVEAGGGYVWEKRVRRARTSDPSAYVGAEFVRKWRTGAALTASYKFVPNLGDFDLSLMVFKLGVAVPLSEKLALTVSLRVDHVLQPPPPAEKTDLLLAVGLRLTL